MQKFMNNPATSSDAMAAKQKSMEKALGDMMAVLEHCPAEYCNAFLPIMDEATERKSQTLRSLHLVRNHYRLDLAFGLDVVTRLDIVALKRS